MSGGEVYWIGLDEVIAALQDAVGSFRKIIVRRLGELGEFVVYLCRIELTDVRYTGALEASFVVEVDSATLKAQIYPQAKHAMYVRMGTKPHWAPIGPLKLWAAAKLGDEKLAYPVQRSIATHGTSVYQERKRGTKANPWPERVVARSDFRAALAKTAESIGAEIVETIA